jgi:hypothetical protein
MMRAIVLGLCLTAGGGIAAYTHYSAGNSGEPVYTVQSRPSPAAPRPSAPTPALKPIDPEDKVALARALQRELKRVGCYAGDVSGVWTASSRMAMKTFVERVNAALPTDNPDPVLLSLVQGHQERVCGVACPAGQTATEGGACMPAAVLVRAARDPKPEPERPAAEGLPVAGAAAAVGTAAAVAAPRAAKAETKAAASEWQTSTSGPARPGTAVQGTPVPPEGMVRERRPRRSAEAEPQPPKVVRDVLRALGFK